MKASIHALLILTLLLLGAWLMIRQCHIEQVWLTASEPNVQMPVKADHALSHSHAADQLIEQLKQHGLSPNAQYQKTHLTLRFEPVNEQDWYTFWHQNAHQMDQYQPLTLQHCHLFTQQENIHAQCRFNLY